MKASHHQPILVAAAMNMLTVAFWTVFAALLGVGYPQAGCAQSKPTVKPLSLEEKARLRYVFIAEFESVGASSALKFAPDLDLSHRSGNGSWEVVIRVVQPIRAPADKPLPERLLVHMYRNWFYEWDRSSHLSLSGMQELVREHYLGKRFIFLAVLCFR